MTTNAPAQILNNNDAVNFLNSAGQNFWNGVIGDVISLEKFTSYGVTAVNVTGAFWNNNGGHAELRFTLKTQSDPVTEATIAGILGGLWDLILIAIGGALIFIPGGGWALDLVGAIVALAGGLGLISTSVTQVGGAILGNPLFILAGIVIIGAAGIAVYDEIGHRYHGRN